MKWSFPPIILHQRPSILIVGNGTVGKVVNRSLQSRGNNTATIDKGHPFTNNHHKECAIVCVDTPTVNGYCDPTNLWDALDMIQHELGAVPIMVKSTITPNIADMLPVNVTYSPEFLRQAVADDDFRDQPFMLLGGTAHGFKFWKKIFRYLKAKPIHTTAVTASWNKYIHNTFLATKVTFFNELDRVADSMYNDKDDFYNAIDIAVENDDSLGSTHMYAPSSDGNYGYAGACFPKDMTAFANWTNSPLLKEIENYNDKLRQQRPN
jgi:UDP-glucose 6-dehydrogenase